MSEPNAVINYAKIVELDGKVNTLEAKMAGEMRRQSEAIEAIKDLTEKMANTVDIYSKRTSDHINQLFDKTNNQSRKLTRIDARFAGHEKLCIERNQAIHEKIASEFKGLKQVLQVEKDVKSEGKIARRYFITTIITIIIALIGWIVAML